MTLSKKEFVSIFKSMNHQKISWHINTFNKILLPNSGLTACRSWANDWETRVAGKKSRFIQNAGIPERWWTLVSKATSLLLEWPRGFIGPQEAAEQKVELATCSEENMSWGPVRSTVMTSNAVLGVIRMSSDGKSQSKIAAGCWRQHSWGLTRFLSGQHSGD